MKELTKSTLIDYKGKLTINENKRVFIGNAINSITNERIGFILSSDDKSQVMFHTFRKNGQFGKFRGYLSINKSQAIEILY